MDSQTTQIDDKSLRGSEGNTSGCSFSVHCSDVQFDPAATNEWLKVSPSSEPVVCRTSALELFSQACSTYIGCEWDQPTAPQPTAPQPTAPRQSRTSASAHCSMDEAVLALPLDRADAKSVDAALPSLLDEIEEFIAYLHDEDNDELNLES